MFKKHLPTIIILSILCWFVYANSISGGFIVDDIPAFKDNPNVKDLGYAIIQYNPQTFLYALTYYLFGFSTAPQHIISILLHNLNVVLAFFLLLKIFDKKIAVIASVLFALHPVNVESVTWMSGRSYLFNGTIFFTTALLYFEHLKSLDITPSNKHKKNTINIKYVYLAFAVLTVLIGNAWTVLIPVLLLILQWGFVSKSKERLKLLVPFFIVVCIYVLVTLAGGALTSRQAKIGEIANIQNNSVLNVDSLIFSLTKSSELLVFPRELTLYHVPTTVMWLVLTILIGIALMFVWAFKFNKSIWYLLTLIYTSLSISLFPFFMTNKVAERYMYLSTFFFSILVAYILTRIKIKYGAQGVTLIICILFGLKIISRNADWKDSVTFWNAEIRTNPQNARLYAELGYTYITEVVDYKLAVKYIGKSLELNPNQFFAYHNLGKIYGDVQNYAQAEIFFKKALELNNTFYLSWYGLAYMEYQQNNKENALAYINKALELQPTYTKAIEMKKRIEQLK